jgi:DNA (cytosine-5)-methyltransferase 1
VRAARRVAEQVELAFPPALRLVPDLPQVDPPGLVVVLFCGGAGSSYGVELATGRAPDFAVNHAASAIAMHMANHPSTRHFQGDVWHARPFSVTRGRHVSILWLSPTCTHFSQAKGGPLRDAGERALAWTAIPWAREAQPDWIVIENVRQFVSWGRLKPNGKIDPKYKGHTFKTFIGKLKALGYRDIAWRNLRACDYGAPTTRDRFFLVANRIGAPIVWPEATHGPGKLPYRTAAECIDWTIPGKSIFTRKKALRPPTLRRIARALHVHVLSGKPYIVPSANDNAVEAGTLIQTSYGERKTQAPRIFDLHEPLTTVVAGGVKHAVITATLVKNYGGRTNGGDGVGMDDPLDTITTQDHHALVAATLVQYNGTSNERDIKEPLGTVTTRDRFGLVQALVARVDAEHGVSPKRRKQIRDLLALGDGDGNADTSCVVTIDGESWVIVDITFRMLTPRELARAMGLPDSFVLDPFHEATTKKGKKVWRRLNQGEQVKCIGNMVVPQIVDRLLRANVGGAAVASATQRRIAA